MTEPITTLIPIEASGQQSLFDYNQIEEVHRDPIQRAAVEIRVHFKRAVSSYIKIGKILNDIHYRFPSIEALGNWFAAEFQGSQRSAYNLMGLARKFEAVEEAVLERIALAALYELAANSTPDVARQNVLQLAGEGHEITKTTARTIIKQAKDIEAEQQTSLLDYAEQIPVCLCGHPADHHADVDCEDCTCEQFEEAPAGLDDVSIHEQIIQQTADGVKCLCGHDADAHEEMTNCKECPCECYEVERVVRENTQVLVEQTETTTIEILPPVKPTKQAKEDVGAQLRGEADLLFESRKITLQIVLQPKKGEDRDVVLALWEGTEFPHNEMCKYSQISDAIESNQKINSLILALKSELLEKAEAAKKAKPVASPAKPATKTTTKTTKVTTAKKGK